tara:strand:+ start:44 stop:325 length:282 start_codon:yes stop_codon:yes gene_type:complete
VGKKEIGQILGGGLGGLIAQEPLAAISPLGGYLKRQRDKKKDRRLEREAAEAAEKERMEKIMSGSTSMSAGGKTRTKPIDGIAIRGKTRGRII